MRTSMPRYSRKDYLTSQEAAKALGVSLRTVQLWVENGSLNAWKTEGGHRRITKESVIDLLGKRKTQIESSERTVGKKIKVLVVEDEHVQIMMYQLRFDQWGLPVELDTAKNGFDALMKISTNPPDVLITDLSLPGMDGIQMVDTLVSSYNILDMKIIAITSLTKEEISAKGGLPESVSVFYKPVPFHMLETMFKDMIDQPATKH